MTEPNILRSAINQVPGEVSGVASICEVSVRAVYKWIQSGRLPRTDYTGETSYAEKMAKASGGRFSAEWLLETTLKETSPPVDNRSIDLKRIAPRSMASSGKAKSDLLSSTYE